MELSERVTTQDVKERLGVGQDEELRESDKRRRYLEKFSRIITPKRPTVRMEPSMPTAAVNQEEGEPVILMTTRDFEQPATEFPPKIYDLIVQEGLTVHEIGHILYTNHESFKTYLGEVDMARKSMFKQVWNILEDGAIEKQLRHRFRVADELEVLNRNLRGADSPGHEVDEDTERYSFFQAVQLGLLDMAVHDSGQFTKILDRDNNDYTLASDDDRRLLEGFVPEMKAVSKDVLSQPNSEKRNERIYEFWKELAEKLDDADVSGENESNLEDLISGDGSIGGGSGDEQSGDDKQSESEGNNAPIDGKPDDTENDFGDGQNVDASELGRGDVQVEVEVQVEVASGGDADDVDEVDAGDVDTSDMEIPAGGTSASAASGDASGGEEDGGFESPTGTSQEEMEEQFRDELAQEASELDGGEAIIEDAEQYLEIIQNGAGDDYRGFTMEIPEVPPREFDRDRWNESQRISNRVARDFRNRLIREQRSKVKRGKRRGRFDRGRMVHAARGSTRVFKKEEEGDEKDYSCIVVLDRSGSMNHDGINEAEIAVASLTSALEDVGVDSSVLDLFHSEARLVKSFGQDVSDVQEHLVNGAASGGTPLAEVLHLARERVTDHDNPFMIVITDGRPGNTELYRDELDKCHFPVLGVYLSGEQKGDEDYFHRQVYVGGSGQDEIRTKLHNLANEVMF